MGSSSRRTAIDRSIKCQHGGGLGRIVEGGLDDDVRAGRRGPDILVDGVPVTGYYAVGAYEIADWKINEGTHLAESEASFGIYQVGYTGVTSYAYPGGLRLKVINPQ